MDCYIKVVIVFNITAMLGDGNEKNIVMVKCQQETHEINAMLVQAYQLY